MFDAHSVNDLTKKFMENLPPGFKEARGEMEKTIHHCFQSLFQKLDLVTRQEFEAQTQVLLRTREKLELLETEIQRMAQAHHSGGEN